MSLLEYAVAGGVLYGVYFALVGLGLNLIFGVLRIINLAHGQFLLLGGYGAYLIAQRLHLNPILGLAAAVLGAIVVGVPLYAAVVPRLQASRDPEMLSFIMFFGLAQMIEAVMILLFGVDQRSLPPDALGSGNLGFGAARFPDAWFVAVGASVLAALAIYLYLSRTRLGYATRAVMANRDEARATGIDVHVVSAIAFVAGLALAGIAGVFLPYLLGSISPALGNTLTTTSFAVIIIGSLGDPLGTIVGGLVFGVSTLLMQTYLPSWSDLVPYALLILIVLVRPSGLLGRAVRVA